jgi:hypothetical protein
LNLQLVARDATQNDGPLRAESETIPLEAGDAASSRSSPLPEGELVELSNEINGNRARHISFLSLGSPNFTSSHPTSDFLWGKARQQPLCFPTPSQLLDHVTRNWRSNFVTCDLNTRELIEYFIKRPFFMLVSVDAPLLERFRRSKTSEDRFSSTVNPAEATFFVCLSRFGLSSLEDFVREHDNVVYGAQLSDSTTFGVEHSTSLHSISDLVNVHIVNMFSSLPGLRKHLDTLDLLNPERLRPGWDTYFMVSSFIQNTPYLAMLTGLDFGIASVPSIELYEKTSRRHPCSKKTNSGNWVYLSIFPL